MSHADIVDIIWGSLGLAVIIGMTIASVFSSMYGDSDEEEDNS